MSSSVINQLPPPLAAFAVQVQRGYAKHGAKLPPMVAFLLAALMAWQLSKLFWLLAPTPEWARWQPAPAFAETSTVRPAGNAQALVDGHLFGEAQVAANTSAQTLASAPDTALNYTLLGILSGTRASESLALIAKDGSDEAPYRLGDDISPGVNLQAIFPDRVILSRNGQLETLRLDKDSPSNALVLNTPPPSTEGTPAAAAMLNTVRTQVLTDPSKAAQYIRVQPISSEGGVRGYRVYPGAERDAFAASGLKPGDVVTAINGVALDNPGKALELLQSLANAPQASLAIERDGAIQTVNISVGQ